jgi:SAM-dependent methyltransferase
VSCADPANVSKPHLFYECSFCQCLQQPISFESKSSNYSSNYYSYNLSDQRTALSPLRNLRNRVLLFAGSRIDCNWPVFQSRPDLKALSIARIAKYSSILDVGCGAGYLLKDLYNLGFKKLAGLDPYVLNDRVAKTTITIHREPLEAHQGIYDYILFNHSLEHIADPFLALSEAYRLLRPGGQCVVRVPVYPSYCFSKFHDNWVQFDPPRHLFIFSLLSMAILSSKVGFLLAMSYNDSTSFGILGSRALLEGKVSRNQIVSTFDLRTTFSHREISEAGLLAQKLNRSCLGDQSCFLLTKPIHSV